MLGVSTTNARVGGFRGKGLSAEAKAWRDNIIANGGTITPAQLAFFETWFFKPAILAGNILTELDRLNIYCNLVGSEIAARTNMIKAAHFVTPVSSPTFDNNGYRSSGTSYLNLNYIASSQAVKLTQNNVNFGCVVKTPSYASLTRMLGALGSTGVRTSMDRLTSPALSVIVNSLATNIINTNTVSVGNVFFEGKRENSLQSNPIINGVGAINNQLSAPTLTNATAFELTVNNNGSPFGFYDTSSHLCSWHGSGALNNTGLRLILNNLFTAAGI
jgi:hypothetical protein